MQNDFKKSCAAAKISTLAPVNSMQYECRNMVGWQGE